MKKTPSNFPRIPEQTVNMHLDVIFYSSRGNRTKHIRVYSKCIRKRQSEYL